MSRSIRRAAALQIVRRQVQHLGERARTQTKLRALLGEQARQLQIGVFLRQLSRRAARRVAQYTTDRRWPPGPLQRLG